MQVTHLSLTDFRNYAAVEVDFAPGPNLFVGSNGQGKTNLVESLGFLSTLGSHRVSTDHAMVRQGADSAIVRAQLEHGSRKVLAEVQINRTGANRAQINRSAIRTRELPRYFSSVLFAPEDLALVRGDPSGRRRFLDDLLALRAPRLTGVMADYDRVVRQRNTLLKTARASGTTRLPTLEIWDERLIEFGSKIIEARGQLVAELTPEVTSAYLDIVGDDHRATLASTLSIDDASQQEVGRQEPLSADVAAGQFRAALERVRRAEVDRAMTLVGPHRDDLVFGLNGMGARGYASHGESWSFALALKLACARVLRSGATGDPVLVLDDVFAELDLSRRDRLSGAVSDFAQVLITAAVADDVPERLAAHTTRISHGTIVG
ncbi:MAG: DNA replication/repair protein RecF [Microbacteriaceae bacterium]|nr:DNA replication/repair protein RecF [Microbacteriaceae bacterium]